MFTERIRRLMFCYLLFDHIHASGYKGETQDQTSPRANTLSDDADDIQKQLDNEARDRLKFGRPKTVWVFHFPNHVSAPNSKKVSTENWNRLLRNFETRRSGAGTEDTRTTQKLVPTNWDYKSQDGWNQIYPECGGRSQSPVDMPVDGLIKTKGARRLYFINYNVMPLTLKLVNDGKRVMLSGEWPTQLRPVIYGGAAHSRRYVFHSLTLHWPSEHTVGGLRYPMESQAIHISAEYKTIEQALKGSPRDPQALLGVANLYKFSNTTNKGLAVLLRHLNSDGAYNGSIETMPLNDFNPSFKEYACYQGSLTAPPCTESVLWMVRARTLPVVREMVEASKDIQKKFFSRNPQPLNDRRVFLFT